MKVKTDSISLSVFLSFCRLFIYLFIYLLIFDDWSETVRSMCRLIDDYGVGEVTCYATQGTSTVD